MREIQRKNCKEGFEKIEDMIEEEKEELRNDFFYSEDPIIRLEEKFS